MYTVDGALQFRVQLLFDIINFTQNLFFLCSALSLLLRSVILRTILQREDATDKIAARRRVHEDDGIRARGSWLRFQFCRKRKPRTTSKRESIFSARINHWVNCRKILYAYIRILEAWRWRKRRKKQQPCGVETNFVLTKYSYNDSFSRTWASVLHF